MRMPKTKSLISGYFKVTELGLISLLVVCTVFMLLMVVNRTTYHVYKISDGLLISAYVN